MFRSWEKILRFCLRWWWKLYGNWPSNFWPARMASPSTLLTYDSCDKNIIAAKMKQSESSGENGKLLRNEMFVGPTKGTIGDDGKGIARKIVRKIRGTLCKWMRESWTWMGLSERNINCVDIFLLRCVYYSIIRLMFGVHLFNFNGQEPMIFKLRPPVLQRTRFDDGDGMACWNCILFTGKLAPPKHMIRISTLPMLCSPLSSDIVSTCWYCRCFLFFLGLSPTMKSSFAHDQTIRVLPASVHIQKTTVSSR